MDDVKREVPGSDTSYGDLEHEDLEEDIKLEPEVIILNEDEENFEDCNKNISQEDGQPTKRAGEEERTFTCPECGKAFLRRNHLQRHEATHTGVRPHVCEDCGAGFFRSEHLARHVKTHSGHERFACPLCGKNLTRPEHLARHLKIHDRQHGHGCPQCGESFVRSRELARHLKSH